MLLHPRGRDEPPPAPEEEERLEGLMRQLTARYGRTKARRQATAEAATGDKSAPTVNFCSTVSPGNSVWNDVASPKP